MGRVYHDTVTDAQVEQMHFAGAEVQLARRSGLNTTRFWVLRARASFEQRYRSLLNDVVARRLTWSDTVDTVVDEASTMFRRLAVMGVDVDDVARQEMVAERVKDVVRNGFMVPQLTPVTTESTTIAVI